MSLTSCPECNHTVSDKAISCPNCGYPMSLALTSGFLPVPMLSSGNSGHSTLLGSPPIPKRKYPQNHPRRKLPNGYGSIKKLSGNRTRPYAVYPPSNIASCPASTDTKSSAIGYYKDWYTAYDALNRYHQNPYDVHSRALTFADVYELFHKEKFDKGRKNLSVSSIYAYEAAFKNCAPLHNIRFFDLRKQEMQDVIDNCSLGYSSLCNLKKLFCQMYRYAMENDIVQKNYAQFVSIHQEDDNEKGEPFSEEELALLWANKEDATVQMILIMIYTGFRIKAFETITIDTEQRYFKGGVKTTAGKGRIVPIHSAILPFVIDFKRNFPEFRARTFRSNAFYPTLKRLGIAMTQNEKKHTPHDCRHTFSWLCDKYKMDELSKHLIMGHSLGKDIEKSVYGHRTFEELYHEMQKIEVPFCR